MNGKINGDGNLIGRLGAAALLIAAGLGLRGLTGFGAMCPVVKTDSCCSGTDVPAKAAPAPVKAAAK